MNLFINIINVNDVPSFFLCVDIPSSPSNLHTLLFFISPFIATVSYYFFLWYFSPQNFMVYFYFSDICGYFRIILSFKDL